MKFALPLVVLSVLLIAGCSTETPDVVETQAPRVAVAQTPTPTPSASVAPAPAAEAPAPPAAPAASAYVDYITPVTSRWGGCFAQLGVGDIYYDSVSSTVTGACNGGVLTWSVGPGDMAGTPADQGSVDALAGC